MDIFIDICIAFFLPIGIPILTDLLAKTKKDWKVNVKNSKPTIVVLIKDFWLELPSAFIANTIWNATYQIKILKEPEIINWNIIFLCLIFFQIIQHVHSRVDPDKKIYMTHIYLMCLIAIAISLYRIYINRIS